MTLETQSNAVLARVVPPLLTGGISVAFLLAVRQYDAMVGSLPRLFALVTLALSLLDLVYPWVEPRLQRWLPKMAGALPLGPKETWREVLGPIAALASLCGLIFVFGFLAASAIYVLLSLLVQAKARPLLAAAVAGGTTFFVWLMFEVVLNLNLYPGLLGAWL